jgi:hypothetical protein
MSDGIWLLVLSFSARASRVKSEAGPSSDRRMSQQFPRVGIGQSGVRQLVSVCRLTEASWPRGASITGLWEMMAGAGRGDAPRRILDEAQKHPTGGPASTPGCISLRE